MTILAWFGFLILAIQFVWHLSQTIVGKAAKGRAVEFTVAIITLPAVLFFIFYLFVR